MITKPCDVRGCTTPSVHIVYKIVLLPLRAPRDYQDAVGKMQIRLCVEHFNEAHA